MAAGVVDAGAVGESPPIFAQAAGSPIRYLAVEPLRGEGSAIIVPNRRPSIDPIAMLKRHRVAFTTGSSTHLVVAKTLQKAGLVFDDIHRSGRRQGRVCDGCDRSMVDLGSISSVRI